MACLTFIGPRDLDQISRENTFSVDGRAPSPLKHGMFKFYKLSSGTQKVIIRSANGSAWECEGYVGSNDCMTIKYEVDGSGAVVDIAYAVGKEPPGAMFLKAKLP